MTHKCKMECIPKINAYITDCYGTKSRVLFVTLSFLLVSTSSSAVVKTPRGKIDN